MSLLKKIVRKLRSLFVRNKEIIRIQFLRFLKKTDYFRWKKMNVFHDNWNDRTALLSDYILPNANIIEFGAGNMFLKNIIQRI